MRFLVLITLLFLPSCGFSPVYGDFASGQNTPSAQAQLAQVRIDNIPNQEGQYLRNVLIDKFYTQGRPQNPLFKLNVERIIEDIDDLDITQESEATRSQITLRTEIKLIDLATRQELLKENLRTTTSYNVLSSQFATIVSERDARETALNDLARQIEMRLSLYFNR